jgi:hypothetical protein
MIKNLILFGNILLGFSLMVILLSFTGLFDIDMFSFGLSSGIRIVGSFAIAGCMINALSYGFLELTNQQVCKEK